MKKRLIKNIQDKGISGAQQSQINELTEKINQADNKFVWLDKSNQHILKALFVGKRETNYLGFFNDVIRCYRGGSGELASEMFITPGQISFKLFDETYYSEDPKARVPREIFIYNREGAIELWSSGEVLVRDPNNFTSKKYVDIVVGDNVHNINQRIDATNTEIATVKTDLGDLGNQVVDNRNETARVDAVVATNSTNIVNLDSRITNTNSLLNSVIDGLRTLRPFNYVGDYVNGTTYKKNDLVSLNNTLYLSKEDNNATTPPGDKWVILQEQVQIDLSNYYTKQEADGRNEMLNAKVDTTDTKVNNLTTRVDTINTELGNKLNINRRNIITTSGPIFEFKPNSDGDTYLEWRNTDGGRYAYFGRPGVGADNFELNINWLDLKFTTANNKDIKLSTRKLQNINNEGIVECKHLQMGSGSENAWITPENNATKTLKFGKNNNGRFNLDLENATKIIGVPDPTENRHAANKQYVDNKFPQFREIVNWTGNLATTDLTFSKTAEFAQPGTYEFIVEMRYLSKIFVKNIILRAENFNKDIISEIWYFVNNNNSGSVANLNTLGTAYSLVLTAGKQIKIIRYGNQHNAGDTTVKIQYRKIQ